MPDPERAAIVRRIFKHYATGTYTKQEILQKATQWGRIHVPRPMFRCMQATPAIVSLEPSSEVGSDTGVETLPLRH